MKSDTHIYLHVHLQHEIKSNYQQHFGSVCATWCWNPLVARQDDAKSVWDFKEVSPQLGTRRQRLTYHHSSPRVQILFGLHVTKICTRHCVTIIPQAETLTYNSTCAVLEVPLDYSNESVGIVNLGIIKMPGDTEDAQEILLNPGGPGGSSVDFVLAGYEAVQAKIGTQYSLVGSTRADTRSRK